MMSRAILGLLPCRAKQGSQFGRVKLLIDDALLPKALSKGLSVLPNCTVNHLLDRLHMLNSRHHSTNGKDLVRVPRLVNLHVGQNVLQTFALWKTKKIIMFPEFYNVRVTDLTVKNDELNVPDECCISRATIITVVIII